MEKTFIGRKTGCIEADLKRQTYRFGILTEQIFSEMTNWCSLDLPNRIFHVKLSKSNKHN